MNAFATPRLPRALLHGLAAAVMVTALVGHARGDDEGPPLGEKPNRSGYLTLPAAGFEVRVPAAHRAVTEAFGRISLRPDGPEVSDEIAVSAPEGTLALSVIVGGASCEAFEALGGVEKEIRVGRATWSRLTQTITTLPAQNGAPDPDATLRATVWCRPGVMVHTVAHPQHLGVTPWLDALANLKAPRALGRGKSFELKHIFLESPETPDEVLALPVRQRFVLAALGAVWQTESPIARVPEPPAADGSALAGPAVDRFELLVPRAWLVRLEIARGTAEDCQRLARAPRGFPEAPAGLFWASAPSAQAYLCQAQEGDARVRITLSAAVPMATALGAALPILNELAVIISGDSQPATEAPRP